MFTHLKNSILYAMMTFTYTYPMKGYSKSLIRLTWMYSFKGKYRFVCYNATY